VTEAAESPGRTLQAARLERSFAVREVAEALNLPIDTVEAIEADQFDRLPSAVFARGYVRAYAKLLELDADALAAACRVDASEQTEVVPAARSSGLMLEPTALLGGAFGVLLLLIIVVLAIWVWPEDEQASSPLEPVATLPQRAPDDAVALASASIEPAYEDLVELAEAAPQAGQPPLAFDDGGRRITPGGDDRLEFAFTEECWVEIKSAAGRNLYSDLSRSGDSLDLVGRGPFRILLGYAPGVSMSFNGEPVALGPHTRNNVANLVLGQ